MKVKQLIILLCTVILLVLAGCKSVQTNTASDSIVGTWKDAYGLTEYKFDTDGKMKIEALNIGSFKGTYHIDNGKITMVYSVVVEKVTDVYTIKLESNTMYLDDKEFTRKE